MVTIAYTASEFAPQVARAARPRRLLQSPPFTHDHPDLPDLLFRIGPRGRGPDLLYLALHGLPNQPYLYGSDHITALDSSTFDRPLIDTVIFAPACHLDTSPLLPRVIAARPRALIIGRGENWSPFVHRLGRTFRILLSLSIPPAQALRLARATLAVHDDHPAALDTLTLSIYTPDQAQPKEVS